MVVPAIPDSQCRAAEELSLLVDVACHSIARALMRVLIQGHVYLYMHTASDIQKQVFTENVTCLQSNLFIVNNNDLSQCSYDVDYMYML